MTVVNKVGLQSLHEVLVLTHRLCQVCRVWQRFLNELPSARNPVDCLRFLCIHSEETKNHLVP